MQVLCRRVALFVVAPIDTAEQLTSLYQVPEIAVHNDGKRKKPTNKKAGKKWLYSQGRSQDFSNAEVNPNSTP